MVFEGEIRFILNDKENNISEEIKESVERFREYLNSDIELSKSSFIKYGCTYFYYMIFEKSHPDILRLLYETSKTIDSYEDKVIQIKKEMTSLLNKLYDLIEKYNRRDESFIIYEMNRFIIFYIYMKFFIDKLKEERRGMLGNFLEKYYKIWSKGNDKINLYLCFDTIRRFIFNIFLALEKENIKSKKLSMILKDLMEVTYIGSYELFIRKQGEEYFHLGDSYFNDITTKYLSKNKKEYLDRIVNLIFKNINILYKNMKNIKKYLEDRVEDIVSFLTKCQSVVDLRDDEIIKFFLGKLDKDYFHRKIEDFNERKDILDFFGVDYIDGIGKVSYRKKLKKFVKTYPDIEKDLRREILKKNLVDFFCENKEILAVLPSKVIKMFLEGEISFKEIKCLFDKFGGERIQDVVLKYLKFKDEYNITLNNFVVIYKDIDGYLFLWRKLEDYFQLLKDADVLGYHDGKFVIELKKQLEKVDRFSELEKLKRYVDDIEDKISKRGLREFIQKRRMFYQVYRGTRFKEDFNFIDNFLDDMKVSEEIYDDYMIKLLSLKNISKIVERLKQLNLQSVLKNKSEDDKIKFLDNLKFIMLLNFDKFLKGGVSKLVDAIIHYDLSDIFNKINETIGGVLQKQDFDEMKKKFGIYCKIKSDIEDIHMCKKILLNDFYYLIKKLVKYGGEELGIELVTVILDLSEKDDLKEIIDKTDLSMDILFRFKDVVYIDNLKIEDILHVEDNLLLNVGCEVLFLNADIEKKIKKRLKDKKYTFETLLDILYIYVLEEKNNKKSKDSNIGNKKSVYITNKQIQSTLGTIINGKKVTSFTYNDVKNLINKLKAKGHKVFCREGAGDHKLYYINGVLVTVPTHSSYKRGTIYSIFKGIIRGMLNQTKTV